MELRRPPHAFCPNCMRWWNLGKRTAEEMSDIFDRIRTVPGNEEYENWGPLEAVCMHCKFQSVCLTPLTYVRPFNWSGSLN